MNSNGSTVCSYYLLAPFVFFVVVFQFGGEMCVRPGVVSAPLYQTPTKRTPSPWPGTTSLKWQRTILSPLQARPDFYMININFWQISCFSV